MRVTGFGVRLTVTAGYGFTVADFDQAEFTAAVAVTVTVCCAAIDAGAVYSLAALIGPAPAGAIVHTTLGFVRSAGPPVELQRLPRPQ